MMIRPSRRHFLGAAIASLSAVLLAACGAPGAPATPATGAKPAAASPVELTIWDAAHDQLTSIRYADEMYDAYSKAQDTVKVTGAHSQGTDKILTAILAGTPPDVAYLWNGQEPLGAWAHQGIIIPIDEYVKAHKFNLGQIHTAALDTCKYQGKLYGIPIGADGMFHYGNVAKIREAGLDPSKPPQTWDQWLQWSLTMTKKDASGEITQLGAPIPGGWPRYNVVWSFGGQLFDASGTKATPDHPAVVEALEFLRSYAITVDIDAVKRYSKGLGGSTTPQNPFINGQVVSPIDGEWTLRYIREFRPEWQLDRDFIINPVPYPKGKSELAKSMHLADYPWVIGKDVKHREEAAGFVLWVGGNKEVQIRFGLNQMNLVALLPALRDDRMLKVPGFGMNVKLFLESKNVKALPVSPAATLMDKEFNRVANDVVDGKTYAREGMLEVKQLVQDELNRKS